MAEILILRLRGIQTLLETAAVEDRIAISRNQAEVVQHMMQGMSLSADKVGEVAAAISSVPWATASEATTLLQGVGSMVHQRKARAALQDFELVCSFLSEPVWDMLLADGDFFSKADGLIDHLSQLGLRNPTEKSVANVTALLLFACEKSHAKSLSPQHVRGTFLHVKGMLKKKLSKTPTTVAGLGTSPCEFRKQNPDVYEAVFCRSPPVNPKIDAVAVYTLGASVQMRSRGSGASPTAVVQSDFQSMMQQALQSTMLSMLSGMQRSGDVPVTFFKPSRGLKALTAGEGTDSQGTPRREHPSFAVPLSFTGKLPADACDAASSVTHPSPTRALPPAAASEPQTPAAAPVVKRTVDEAAASILAAMGKKKEKRKPTKISKSKGETAKVSGEKGEPATATRKRPAAAVKSESADDDDRDGKPPSISIEASRNQVLFRTGLPGKGQNKIFKYTSEASKDKAIAEAKKMVKAEERRRGLV